jgi:hypothetical protein
MTGPAERYRHYLETLTPESLGRLPDYVSENVRFRDPFNDVTGVEAMTGVFAHMFETLGSVRFMVTTSAMADRRCLMSWRFEARLRGRALSFDGMSEVRFDDDGRVIAHFDHWDAGSAIYERLPVIGSLLAALRRRIARQAAAYRPPAPFDPTS